jgi:hypothetical protein
LSTDLPVEYYGEEREHQNEELLESNPTHVNVDSWKGMSARIYTC